MKTISLSIEMTVDDEAFGIIKQFEHHIEDFIKMNEHPEIKQIQNVKVQDITKYDDRNTIAITLIRNRPSENEQWAETFGIKVTPIEETMNPEEVLRKKIQKIMASKIGWKLNCESFRDFNWGDFICNIGAFAPAGITEDTSNAIKHATIIVDTDEHLTTFESQGVLFLYDDTKTYITNFNCVTNMDTGEITLSNDDLWKLETLTSAGTVASADFVNENGSIEADPDEYFEALKSPN